MATKIEWTRGGDGSPGKTWNLTVGSAMSWAVTAHSPSYVPGVDGDVIYHQRPWPLANVWLGTSIESDRYTWRADHLRATPPSRPFRKASEYEQMFGCHGLGWYSAMLMTQEPSSRRA